VHSTVARGDQQGKGKGGRGRHPKTCKAQDEAMVEEALKNRHTRYEDILRKIAPDLSDKTIKRRQLSQIMTKQGRFHMTNSY